MVDLSRDAAVALRRHYLEHGSLFQAPFFLLVSQDKGYLWNQQGSGTGNLDPIAELPMQRVTARYLPSRNGTDRLPEEVQELVVTQWLADLTSPAGQTPEEEPERTLADAGFLQLVRGGTVEAQP